MGSCLLLSNNEQRSLFIDAEPGYSVKFFSQDNDAAEKMEALISRQSTGSVARAESIFIWHQNLLHSS